jgi:hypothetical protein
MPTPPQYRAKALAYSKLAKTADSAQAAREFHEREHSLIALADNEHWLVAHQSAVQAAGNGTTTTEDENDASEGGRQKTQ